MYMLIRYPVGIIVEAVVLARGKERLRVAAAGFPDAVELTHSGSQWFAPTHQPVELEFLMSDAYSDETVDETFTQTAPFYNVRAVAASIPLNSIH